MEWLMIEETRQVIIIVIILLWSKIKFLKGKLKKKKASLRICAHSGKNVYLLAISKLY